MEWIKVADRLPEYNNLVLVMWNNIHGETIQSVASVSSISRHSGENPPMDDRWWINCSRAEIKTATHWMPLPNPPKD